MIRTRNDGGYNILDEFSRLQFICTRIIVWHGGKGNIFMTTVVVAVSFDDATYEMVRQKIIGRVIPSKKMMYK